MPSPENAKHKTGRDIALSFGTNAFGGLLAWAVIHPMNTLGVRLNLSSATSPTGRTSFFTFSSSIVKNEGFLTLYSGLGAGFVRQIFYATSRLGFYEVFRDGMAKRRQLGFLERCVLASTAGGLAAVISCPAEVSLVRMSNDMALPPEQRRNYKSVFDAAIRITREEGVRAFWRGSTPFMIRAAIVGASQVATYDQFKINFQSMGVPEGIQLQALSSMSAGLVYSIVTMPFETAKNRMAFQKKDQVTGLFRYRGTIQTILSVATTEGILRLWNGFLPYYLRSGGHTVCMFIAIDQLKALRDPFPVTNVDSSTLLKGGPFDDRK